MDISYSHNRPCEGYRFTNRELPMPSGGFNHQISCTCYQHVLITCGGKQSCPPLGICNKKNDSVYTDDLSITQMYWAICALLY